MTLPTYSNRPGDGTTWSWPPVHSEGHKFAGIAAAICGVFALLGWETLAWPMGLVTLWVLAFFRDPTRVTPTDPALVVAPADGLITLIQSVPAPPEFRDDEDLGGGNFTRVSIFMSVFDVHINRTPIAGAIKRVVYIPGKFVNADLDKASEDNERQHWLVEGESGVKIGFTQIAGLVARRIVPWAKPGDIVAPGQRIGMIRFGSRVDVYLPADTEPLVLLGQKCVAGETVIARLGNAPEMIGVAQ